jgi:hypothetical protein
VTPVEALAYEPAERRFVELGKSSAEAVFEARPCRRTELERLPQTLLGRHRAQHPEIYRVVGSRLVVWHRANSTRPDGVEGNVSEEIRFSEPPDGPRVRYSGVALDFGRVLDTVAGFFERTGGRYAIAGAFALHAYGLSRGTLDLDFVVPVEAQAELVHFFESLGYETLHRSAGYSNHLHALADLGRIDVVYVAGETSRRLFREARAMGAPDGRSVPVPRPEHLAAMKVQAMKNDPQRALRDLDDVRFLLQLPGIDEAEVRGYFERAGLRERYEELKRLG